MPGAMATGRKALRCWSYKAGRKGFNRVRAYEDGPGGDLFLEWSEPLVGGDGTVVLDPRTGRPRRERPRLGLTARGVTTRAEAVAKAEEMAALIAHTAAAPLSGAGTGPDRPRRPASLPEHRGRTAPVTLGALLELYMREVVPTTAPVTRRGSRAAAAMFLAFFGPGAVVERTGRAGRPVTELGLVRFHAWMQARREGRIPGFPHRCGRGTILSNFRFLRRVFEWGTREREDGAPLLVRNPWRAFTPPAEDNPARPEMTRELHDRIASAAPNWRMALVMELCRETRRRSGSVRCLEVGRIDLEARTITWAAEFDKARKTTTTRVTARAMEAIRQALEHREADGVAASPWLFPGIADPSLPVPGATLQKWMRLTRQALGIRIPRLGYHGEKRAGIRDPRWQQLPDEWREALSGTTAQTEKRVYGYVGLDAMEKAVAFLDGDAAPVRPRRGRRRPWRPI